MFIQVYYPFTLFLMLFQVWDHLGLIGFSPRDCFNIITFCCNLCCCCFFNVFVITCIWTGSSGVGRSGDFLPHCLFGQAASQHTQSQGQKHLLSCKYLNWKVKTCSQLSTKCSKLLLECVKNLFCSFVVSICCISTHIHMGYLQIPRFPPTIHRNAVEW